MIDKLPFPRPDDPLLSARRELLGAAAFDEIDVPRAATMLAQACGRLIRTADDRGVVAVLDSRLGTARYRWDIVSALPPMRRTRDRAEVEASCASCARQVRSAIMGEPGEGRTSTDGIANDHARFAAQPQRTVAPVAAGAQRVPRRVCERRG